MDQKVKIIEKHTRAIRWLHWIHFPLLMLMIWSGLLIYWANPVYIPLSEKASEFLHLNSRLAEGMGWHFMLMWFFLANGVLYTLYLIFTGEWRLFIPSRIPGKFNNSQKIAYVFILINGFFAILTGLAIYKPAQLGLLTEALGGYEAARLQHFVVMCIFVLFFAVHVLQVARAGWNTFRAMVTGYEITTTADSNVTEVNSSQLKRRLLLSSLTGLVFFVGLYFTKNFVSENVNEEDQTPVAMRTFFRFNEMIATIPNRPIPLCVEKPRPPKGKLPRSNGLEGLNSPVDLKNYSFEVISGLQQLKLTPAEIQQQPSVEVVTEFKCIEGWSAPIHYRGLKFSDFMRTYHVGQKSDGSYYKYVGLETPDGQYYVSIDMKSMLHPQTVLAYEMNEAPLSLKNGAPLRLIIPIKYGIKSLKRIGRIFFADERPRDFWTEQGYDWYSGL